MVTARVQVRAEARVEARVEAKMTVTIRHRSEFKPGVAQKVTLKDLGFKIKIRVRIDASPARL